jgi:hypothetical protein
MTAETDRPGADAGARSVIRVALLLRIRAWASPRRSTARGGQIAPYTGPSHGHRAAVSWASCQSHNKPCWRW